MGEPASALVVTDYVVGISIVWGRVEVGAIDFGRRRMFVRGEDAPAGSDGSDGWRRLVLTECSEPRRCRQSGPGGSRLAGVRGKLEG